MSNVSWELECHRNAFEIFASVNIVYAELFPQLSINKSDNIP